MKIYALLIGVNRYDAGIGALKCAAKDARKLESLFDHKCRFQTRYLEQEDLHSGVVEQAIEQAGKELAGGGVFVFYFSGHGKQQGDDQIMLLPGAKRDLLEKGLTRHSGVFSYQTLRAMTSGWKGVRRLFIFDACRAMLPTKSGDMQPAFEGIGIRRDPGMANKTAWEAEHDFTELNSCGPGQASLELPEDKGGPGHGVFTLALLESLNTAFDDQRPVCVDERFVADLRTRMTAIAERHGERLCGEPTLYGEPVTLWEGLGGKTDDVRDQREEQRGQQIQGLLADFERQLRLGNLERPVTDNCRDTLDLPTHKEERTYRKDDDLAITALEKGKGDEGAVPLGGRRKVFVIARTILTLLFAFGLTLPMKSCSQMHDGVEKPTEYYYVIDLFSTGKSYPIIAKILVVCIILFVVLNSLVDIFYIKRSKEIYSKFSILFPVIIIQLSYMALFIAGGFIFSGSIAYGFYFISTMLLLSSIFYRFEYTCNLSWKWQVFPFSFSFVCLFVYFVFGVFDNGFKLDKNYTIINWIQIVFSLLYQWGVVNYFNIFWIIFVNLYYNLILRKRNKLENCVISVES